MFGSTAWMPSSVVEPRHGAAALLIGSAAVTGFAMLSAVPLGLLGAIYLAELAPPRVRELGKVVVELLAAIPSVVWGFIALTVSSRALAAVFDIPVGLNAANRALWRSSRTAWVRRAGSATPVRSCCWASWSSTARPSRCSRARATPGRVTISPAASGDELGRAPSRRRVAGATGCHESQPIS